MLGDVWLIIPTFNESDNLVAIVTAAHARLSTAVPGAFRILVVDDNSPDGTGEIAERLCAQLPELDVLHRAGKGGLGQAYVAGFTHALARGAELVIEMDADFSHDPAHLPELIAAAQRSDVVLGSRYVPGGGVRNWSLLRRLISRGGGAYARAILGIDVRDVTGGFKAIHRHVLQAIDLDSVRAEGYVFQIEVTYRAIAAGFTVTEIPITFCDRTAGASKMSARIALEAMLRVPSIRRQTPRAAAADSRLAVLVQ
jgi:dolichol-phosphate mannosyltransferase